jgi:hypothetical protein
MSIRIDRERLAKALNLVRGASYIVYREGDMYYAVNGVTGLVDFSSTDASEVIQKAINALPDGGEVFIKTGVYRITKTISLKHYVKIRGEGHSTLLEPDSNVIVFSGVGTEADRLRYVVIESLTFAPPQPDGTTTAIYLEQALDPIIKDCYFHNLGYAIKLRYVFRPHIMSVYVSGCFHPTIVAEHSPDVHIIDSVFDLNKGDAVQLLGTLDGIHDGGHKIIGCLFINNGNQAVFAKGVFASEISNCVIDMNGRGIELHNVEDFRIVNNSISENTIVDGDLIAVYHVDPTLRRPRNIVIVNNDIRNPRMKAIRLNNVSGFVIANNTIRGKQPDYSDIAILIENGSENGVISNNFISGLTEMEGGFINDGIYLADAKNVIVKSNRVMSCRYGVYLAGTSVDNYVIDNDLRGNRAGGINPLPNNVIKRNLGYITENSDVAVIVAGSTRVTVSHGLAKTPSKVLATPYGNIKIWIENITDTSFDIVTDTAPTTNISVAWYAEV